MSAPVPSFDLFRHMKNAFDCRLRLVTYARQHGIKAAAREFQTTVPTVRKGRRRYQAHKLNGLQELSPAPGSCPHKIPGELAERGVARRRRLPPLGAQGLQREGDLPLPPRAIPRLLRQQGLLRPRRRQYQKKQDRAAWKRTGALFPPISAAPKERKHLPPSGPPMKAPHLPPIPYTARQVRSGLPFLA
jgi:hypothetical protein